MKKRSLTLVMAYSLLAACIGSAEAKKIDATYDADAGSTQSGTYPNPKLLRELASSGLTLDGSDAGMKWLLAYYYGVGSRSIEEVPYYPGEVLPTGDYEGEEIGFGDNLADLIYADRFVHQLAAIPISTGEPTPGSSPAATTHEGSPSEKDSGKTYWTSIPPELYDPPVVIHINEPIRPNEKTPPPAADPAPRPEKPPKVKPPSAGPVPIVEDKPSIPADLPDKTRDSQPNIPDSQPGKKQPQVKSPVGGSVADESGNKLPILISLPDKTKKPQHDAERVTKAEVVSPTTVGSPTPVPEPATMLLFSTGMAGLAFSRLRRNKSSLG